MKRIRKNFTSLTSLGIMLTAFTAATARADSANSGDSIPEKTIRLFAPSEKKGNSAQQKSPAEQAQEEYENKANEINPKLFDLIADPEATPQDIEALLDGFNMTHFDKGDWNFLEEAREKVLGGEFRQATEQEVRVMIRHMHNADKDLKNKIVLGVFGGLIALGGLGVAGLAYRRNKRENAGLELRND